MEYVYRNFVTPVNLQLFAVGPIGTTTGYTNDDGTGATAFDTTNTLSPGMKTFYDTDLLENARPKQFYTQFGKHQTLPANHGTNIEFRGFKRLPNAKKITEGVIPKATPLSQYNVPAKVDQYGMYVAVSDRLDLHHVDNVLLGASVELGASAGNSADVLARDELMCGTNVIYADTLDSNGDYSATPAGRYAMKANNNKLTSEMVKKIATFLTKLDAPQINGEYIGIIHPSQSYDLRDAEWEKKVQYQDVQKVYNGEIGKLHGIRFIASNNCPIFAGKGLLGDTANLTVASYSASDTTTSCTYGTTSAYKVTVDEVLSAGIAEDLVGRKAHVYDTSASATVGTIEICGASTSAFWLKAAPPVTLADGDELWPGEGGDSKTAGQASVAVYGSVFMGADAYGIVDPEGGGLEMLVHDKRTAGGPLEQFSTAGYKFESNGATILYQDRIVRVETCSTFSLTDDAQ